MSESNQKKHLFEIADENSDGVVSLGIWSAVVLFFIFITVMAGTQHLRDQAEYDAMKAMGVHRATSGEWVSNK